LPALPKSSPAPAPANGHAGVDNAKPAQAFSKKPAALDAPQKEVVPKQAPPVTLPKSAAHKQVAAKEAQAKTASAKATPTKVEPASPAPPQLNPVAPTPVTAVPAPAPAPAGAPVLAGSAVRPPPGVAVAVARPRPAPPTAASDAVPAPTAAAPATALVPAAMPAPAAGPSSHAMGPVISSEPPDVESYIAALQAEVRDSVGTWPAMRPLLFIYLFKPEQQSHWYTPFTVRGCARTGARAGARECAAAPRFGGQPRPDR